jgi:hypothetical protein
VEEVRLILLLTTLATAVAPIQGAHSFSTYTSRSLWTVPAPEITAVGAVCEFDFAGASQLYGVRYNEDWMRRSNLKDAGHVAETDLYQTAEIWRAKSGGEVFASWSISADTADEDEAIGCIAPDGKLKAFVTTHTRTRPDSGHLEWRYNRQAEYAEDGQQLSNTTGFITYAGLPSVPPKLSAEERRGLNSSIDPAAVVKTLQKIEAGIRKDHAAQR